MTHHTSNPTDQAVSSRGDERDPRLANPTVRACLIVNPRAGRGDADLGPVLPILAAHGWAIDIRRKHIDGSGSDLARQAAQDGYDVVIACGGDGTVRDVVNGLVGSDVALGVLPAGTANLWAHEVGIALQLDQAARQLVGAQRRRVDVGRVTINDGRARHFLLMAGLGLDGAVMARVSRRLENRIGRTAVVWAGLCALISARRTPVQVDLEDVSWQGHITQIVVGNTRHYAGITRMTPNAYIDDGRLDVQLLTTHRPLEIGRQFCALLIRKRPSRASTVSDRVGHVTITAPHSLPLQLDGSPVRQPDDKPDTEMVYTISVVPQGLTVLVPRTYDGQLFSTGLAARSPLQLATESTGNGNGKTKLDRLHKSDQLQVISVGVDSITALRPSDGRVLTVSVDRRTRAIDADGTRQPLTVMLGGLAHGDRFFVRARADSQNGIVRARQLRMQDPAGSGMS